MGMTMVGATGATKTEMRQALQIPDSMSDEEVHKCISKQLLEKCKEKEDVEFYVANRIFHFISGKLREGFSQTCKEMYASDVGLVSSSISAYH